MEGNDIYGPAMLSSIYSHVESTERNRQSFAPNGTGEKVKAEDSLGDRAASEIMVNHDY